MRAWKWAIGIALSFVVVGIGQQKSCGVPLLPERPFRLDYSHLEAESSLVRRSEHVIVQDHASQDECLTTYLICMGEYVFPRHIIVDRAQDIVPCEEGLFNGLLPDLRLAEIINRERKRDIHNAGKSHVAHAASGRLPYVLDVNPKFRDVIRPDWSARGFVDIYRHIRPDLSVSNLSIGADSLPSLPQRKPQRQQSHDAKWNANNPNNTHHGRPSGHFLLGFQILIGCCLFPIGLYLVYKAHSDDINGSERDGAALCYFLGGFGAVLLGSLIVLIISFPVG